MLKFTSAFSESQLILALENKPSRVSLFKGMVYFSWAPNIRSGMLSPIVAWLVLLTGIVVHPAFEPVVQVLPVKPLLHKQLQMPLLGTTFTPPFEQVRDCSHRCSAEPVGLDELDEL